MGKVSTQQSGGYQIITSIASLKIKASSTALKWLSNTHLARAIIIFDAQFVLRKGVGGEWLMLPYITASNLKNFYGFTVQNVQVFVVMRERGQFVLKGTHYSDIESG